MAQHDEQESLGFPYDVFLSFRDEDTREKFIGHLRDALFRKGIIPFINEKNPKMGESMSPALTKAIKESRVFIVVFSENYASSTRCLDELVEIIERSRNKDNTQRVFPIFYHVNPSDIRHQRNRFGEHMIVHENNFGKGSQRVKIWRSALTAASNFPGEHFSTGSRKYEITLIEEIIDKVYKYIAPKPLHTGQNPVGLGSRVEYLKKSLLEMKLCDKTVHMLGIYGLGGIGKTELAKALYDKIVRDFDAAYFLTDVREKSNKNGLEDLQKTLLSEMFEDIETKFGSTSEGMRVIKDEYLRKKVLLVLDDVDDKDQLEKLVGRCDWFGSGSCIIITTRYKDVLIVHKVEKIYEMKELDEQYSLELFCWNAFKQSHPKPGFGNVSSRAVRVSKRLPLALKVIGSDLATLYGESLDAWECALEEYDNTPPNDKILNVLKISYDRLGYNAKQVFLDIACFFKGEKIEYVKKILHEFGASNINVLVNKSLLTFENGCLKMHDLIQDMGREIVRLEAPNKPGERSRLWYYKEIIEILTEEYGSDNIQGIMLDPPQQEKVKWSGTAFEKMKWLRILIVRNTLFSLEPKHLPNHLKVLDWEEYPSEAFPSKFHPKNIIVFNLPRSHLPLEEPFKRFSCLTIMNFSYNQSITEMPDASEIPSLRELRLDHCRHLIRVHDSVGFLKRLAHLSASECTQLRNFLGKMFLPSLEVLDLNLCGRLEDFPEIMEEMNKPLKIYMTNTAIKVLPQSIDKLIGLVSIEMSSSRKLKYLPSSLFMLPNNVAFKIGGSRQLLEPFRSFTQSLNADNVSILQTLNVENSSLSDGDLLTILTCFPKLKELIASNNKFVSLPACIKECVHLISLDVSFCKRLRKIPECPNLKILKINHCVSLDKISELPFVQKVDGRHTSLSEETSNTIWFQAAKGMRELEVVMPQTEIPEWFDFIGNGENPCFWVRGKVPALALALVFQDVMGWGREGRHQILQLQLVINGLCVSRKGYKFRIAEGHVLICDPRILFSEEEWLGLDALLEHDDWNVVNVSYQAPPPLILSQWGVYVYEEGANMKDVQFVCPDSKYLDMPPTAIVPTEEDPKQERKRLIENFCMDEVLEASVLEYMKVFEKHKVQKDMEEVYSKIAFWKKVSKQAKDELKSEGSDLEDKHSLLTTFLKNSYASTHEIFHDEIDDLPQQKEIMRKIFSDGVRDGLLETLAKFPSLNIFKAKSVALRKGNKVRWYYDKMPGVVKQYVGGIISGVLEAKLHFPDLKTSEILAPTYRMVGRNYAHDNLFRPPLVRFINEVKVDLGQQALSRYAYYDGVTDGLYEAQNSFPYLDIIETRNVAINKMGFWSVLDDEFVRLIRTFETMESYIQGVLGGLIEAKRSFPDLNIKKTLSRVLLRMVNFNVSTVEDVPDNFLGKDFTLLEELKDEEKESMDIIREASSSTYGHQGSEEEQGNDPQQEKTLREIFFEGITDALVQARINFPSLDINKTRSAALNANIYGHRAVWSLPEEGGGNPHLPIAKKIYIEGVVNGLLEAKLSFPNLNISETLNTLRSRKLKTSFVTELDWNKVIHPPPGSHDPPFSKLEGESKFPFNLVEDKLLEYKDVAPNVDSDPGTSSGKNQYDESIQEFNTQSDEFVSTKLDCASGTRILTDNGCKCETKYGKVSTVLKGRDEELGKLYHDRIESFQKSEEFHDLMIATYLNGLRDGLVEAQAILLAQDVGTNSGD